MYAAEHISSQNALTNQNIFGQGPNNLNPLE